MVGAVTPSVQGQAAARAQATALKLKEKDDEIARLTKQLERDSMQKGVLPSAMVSEEKYYELLDEKAQDKETINSLTRQLLELKAKLEQGPSESKISVNKTANADALEEIQKVREEAAAAAARASATANATHAELETRPPFLHFE